MTSTDLNFAIQNTTARLYQLPEGTEIEFKTPLEITFEVNGHYIETAEVRKLYRYGVGIDLEGKESETREWELYSPSDLFNPSDILQIFETCKEARPDLFKDAQQEPTPQAFIKIGYGAGLTAKRTPAEIAHAAYNSGLLLKLREEVENLINQVKI